MLAEIGRTYNVSGLGDSTAARRGSITMNFDVFGPFALPRNEDKDRIADSRLDELYNKAEESCKGLLAACGCYVFVIRAAKGYTPWYVGRTKKQTLKKEPFTPTNLRKYESVLRHGTPMIFFIPIKSKNNTRFRKQNSYLDSVDFLEKWLIAEALKKNIHLLNSRDTKFVRKLHVRGIFNATHGEATCASTELSRAMW